MYFHDDDTILSYAITAIIVTLSAVWLYQRQKLLQTRATYNAWIVTRALTPRDAKKHAVLDEIIPDDTEFTRDGQHAWYAYETRDLIAKGQLDARRNVVFLSQRCRAYGRQAANAVAEEFYDEAAAHAALLKPTRDAPVLYGVPISVKECLALKGSYSTGGLACRLRQRNDQDCLVVQVLRKAGAIPLVSGNVTQVMMLFESVNRIWGRSNNPYDRTRTPGGSSGGDAALVSMGCVPLSASTDVAGSIRIPATFCGVVGFKPTPTRMSSKGCMMPRKNNRSGTSLLIPSVIGPIARKVEDCALFMRAVLVPEVFEADLNVVPLPFDEGAYQSKKKLKLAYFTTDGWFEPCATSKRAVLESVAALRKLGHECVEVAPPTDGWETYGLLAAINGAEGNFRSFVQALEGEEMIPEYDLLLFASNLPTWLRWILSKLVEKRKAHLLTKTRSGGVTVAELWESTADLAQMRKKWSDFMVDNGIDAFIFPTMPIPALKHGMSGELTSAVSYVAIANLLMWPCGTVPVATIRGDETYYEVPLEQKGGIARLAEATLKDSAGLPMGVCVMTAANRDETCLRLMRDIEGQIPFNLPTALLKYLDHA